MSVRFAKSDVDQFFAERDALTLYWVVGVLSQQGSLPEECWLFARLLEWAGATRSGIWQHYEGLTAETFERMGSDLERFGLSEIAQQYRSGWHLWQAADQAVSLDRWIDDHEQFIQNAALDVLARRRDALCPAA